MCRESVKLNRIAEFILSSLILGGAVGLGVWMSTKYNFVPNRRGGLNLIYNGYLYTAERKYHSTVNWVCNKNSNLHLKCPARCITAGNNTIKLSRRQHNHEPVIKDNFDYQDCYDIGGPYDYYKDYKSCSIFK